MNMNLEEIMKPYFDKQNEIKNNYEVRKNSLRMQLERIRDNKESEIAEYIQNAVLDGRDFYAGYSAMIREDLERAYAQREAELEKEIANVDNYYRVDVREAIEIKSEIRKDLVAAKKELELNLMEAKIEFDTVMFKLKRFNYVYDENHNVLNGNEFKDLYAESNRLIEVKYGYETELKKLEEYLQMTELTEEEIKIGMMSMTPWEKEEYDRRKSLKVNEEIPQFDLAETLKKVAEEQEEDIPFELTESMEKEVQEQKEQIEQELFEEEEKEDDFDFDVVEHDELPIEEEKEDITDEIEENLSKEIEQIEKEMENEETEEEKIQRDIIDSSLDLEEAYDESNIKLDEQHNVIAESYDDLLYYIFEDVAEEAKRMRSIKIDKSKGELPSSSRYISTSEDGRYSEYEVRGEINNEEVTLPNGEFINKKDIFKAIDSYRKSNKGRTFTVAGKEYEVTRKTARNLKKALKHCTTITLLNEKKITEFDMKRAIGKNMTEDGSEIDLGRVATDLPKGDYINAEEFLVNLRNVFEEKKTSWFKKTWEKMRNRSNENNQQLIEASEVQELEEENVKVR